MQGFSKTYILPGGFQHFPIGAFYGIRYVLTQIKFPSCLEQCMLGRRATDLAISMNSSWQVVEQSSWRTASWRQSAPFSCAVLTPSSSFSPSSLSLFFFPSVLHCYPFPRPLGFVVLLVWLARGGLAARRLRERFPAAHPKPPTHAWVRKCEQSWWRRRSRAEGSHRRWMWQQAAERSAACAASDPGSGTDLTMEGCRWATAGTLLLASLILVNAVSFPQVCVDCSWYGVCVYICAWVCF